MSWAILLLFSALISGGSVASRTVGQHLAAGDAALSSGQYTVAISEYTAALAIAHTSQGNHQKALQDLDSALSLKPASNPARLSRFVLRGEQKRWKVAHQGCLCKIVLAADVPRSQPRSQTSCQSEKSHQRAKLHRLLCHCDAARADVADIMGRSALHKGAVAELKSTEEVERLLNISLGTRQQRKGAINELLSVAPHCTSAKGSLAEILLEERDYGGVVSLTGQILRLEPANVPALLLRGHAYLHLGDVPVSVRHFSEALRSDPDHREAMALFRSLKQLQRRIEKAEAAIEAGRHEEAEADYEEALKLGCTSEPVTSALWLELCRARVQLGRASAAEACTTAQEMRPEDEVAIVLKVKALIGSKEYGAAVREAGAARQKFRNSQQLAQVLREAEKAQKMAERKQYYEILGVNNMASDTDIKRAYRELARRYHPDKAGAEGISAEEAHDKFTDIAEAYEVLSDGERRMAYDRGDDLRESHGGGGAFSSGFGGGGQHFTFHFG